MSSTMGVISEASAASRDLEKPLGLIDGIMLAYKASKTAVTQSAHLMQHQPCGCLVSGGVIVCALVYV